MGQALRYLYMDRYIDIEDGCFYARQIDGKRYILQQTVLKERQREGERDEMFACQGVDSLAVTEMQIIAFLHRHIFDASQAATEDFVAYFVPTIDSAERRKRARDSKEYIYIYRKIFTFERYTHTHTHTHTQTHTHTHTHTHTISWKLRRSCSSISA